MTEPAPRSAPALTRRDWLLLFAIMGIAIVPIGFHLRSVAFGAMFKDLGSQTELPWITQFALSWWFPLVLGLPAIALLARALIPRRTVEARHRALLIAIVVGVGWGWVAGAGIFGYGMYAPIFALAGKIKE